MRWIAWVGFPVFETVTDKQVQADGIACGGLKVIGGEGGSAGSDLAKPRNVFSFFEV